MANLSRLGQVAVPKPGTPFENVSINMTAAITADAHPLYRQRAPALRTLLSRDPTSAPYKESVPQLTASQLTALLDRIKTVDSADVPAVKKLYSDYGVTAAQMSALRKWINSPSIDKEKTKVIISEQGEESVEMTASLSHPPYWLLLTPEYRLCGWMRLAGPQIGRPHDRSRFHAIPKCNRPCAIADTVMSNPLSPSLSTP